MKVVELDKLRLLKEIRKEAKYLVKMGYGAVRFERKITDKELTDDEDQNEVSDV